MNNETAASVQVTKIFPVSREKLYLASTEPDQLKQWWKPMNKQLLKVENYIREGGNVTYEFEDDLRIVGEYKEVEQGRKLVYSWIWELPEDPMHRDEYLLSVEFNDNGNGSRLDVRQENFENEQGIKPHEEGWEQSLEDLKSYLSRS